VASATERTVVSCCMVAVCACTTSAPSPDFDHPDERVTGLLRRVECVRSKGRVACRGDNERGMLGRGTTGARVDAFVPIEVPRPVTMLALSPSESFACVVDTSRSIWCWGVNNHGILGENVPLFDGLDEAASVAKPGRVAGIPPVAVVQAGHAHACALTTAGEVYCWGLNNKGQVADPRVDSRMVVATPTKVAVPGVAKRLYLQVNQSCAVAGSDELYCWGGSVPGQPAAQPAYAATKVGSGVTTVETYRDGRTCARTAAGETCWSSDDPATRGAFEEPLVRRRRPP